MRVKQKHLDIESWSDSRTKKAGEKSNFLQFCGNYSIFKAVVLLDSCWDFEH